MNIDKAQPLVTVYMPTYNRFELLQRAVDSVLQQDYRNIELIVVDDNSTDGTHQYLAEMAEKDSRFRYFINEKNSGACVSRNKAIFAANGEFITGLDDDDYFLEGHISGFVQNCKLLEHKYIALYSNSCVEYKLENDSTTRLIKYKKIKKCSHRQLLTGNWIGNQIFTKTEYLKEISGFEETLPAWQDLECWYRLLNYYKLKAYLIPQFTYVVDRSHPHERITTKKNTARLIAYEIICNKHDLSSRQRETLKLLLKPDASISLRTTSIVSGFIQAPSVPNFKRTISLMSFQLREKVKRKGGFKIFWH